MKDRNFNACGRLTEVRMCPPWGLVNARERSGGHRGTLVAVVRRDNRVAELGVRGVLAAGGLPADGVIELEFWRRFAVLRVIGRGLIPIDGVPQGRGTRRGNRRRSGRRVGRAGVGRDAGSRRNEGTGRPVARQPGPSRDGGAQRGMRGQQPSPSSCGHFAIPRQTYRRFGD